MLRMGVAVAAIATIAGACAAQVAHTSPEPTRRVSLLRMSAEEQVAIYPAIETAFQVDTIERGAYVRPLPKASTEINPTWTHDGKTWTVEAYMEANRVSGVLVLKDGEILLERYGLGRTPDQRWTSFSVAKSVTSTLVGAAIQDGRIKSLHDRVTTYIPELAGSGYDGVTIRQLLMMSSGVKWNESYTDPNSDVARYSAEPREASGAPPVVSYMRKLEREVEPGTRFHYSTGETDLVGILVENAVGKTLSEYASDRLWKPIGMEQDGIWISDDEGRDRGGCCMSMTLRDYGRFGQFILEGGVARGARIVPEWWTKEATTPQIGKSPSFAGYGYFWWMEGDDSYAAIGIFGQAITIFPEDRLIIVSNSAWPRAEGRELYAAQAGFIDAARTAATGL